MDKFIWSEKYSVGVKIIDEQHQHFFEITNKLLDLAHAENPTREQLIVLLGELGDYALYHLTTEESFFRELSYEDAQPHIVAHNEYRDMVEQRFAGKPYNEVDVDLEKLSVEMAVYSSEWLQNHILVMDKQFTEFFNKHGFN